MAAGFIAFGALAGGLLSLASQFVAVKIGLRSSWIGRPPLVWAVPFTAAALAVASAVMCGMWALL